LEDEIEKLTKLKSLLDAGAITRDEFERMKGEILATNPVPKPSISAPKESSKTASHHNRQLILVVVVIMIVLFALFVFASFLFAGHKPSNDGGVGVGFAVTSVTLHVFENGESNPFNSYFEALNVTGIGGTNSITNIDVYLNNVDLGAPPTGCCYQGIASGQPWSARYPALPITVTVGQSYEVRIVTTFSNGGVSTISRQVSATACNSLFTC